MSVSSRNQLTNVGEQGYRPMAPRCDRRTLTGMTGAAKRQPGSARTPFGTQRRSWPRGNSTHVRASLAALVRMREGRCLTSALWLHGDRTRPDAAVGTFRTSGAARVPAR